MFPTLVSVANHLPLTDVIDRLNHSPQVAGIALFGSSTAPLDNSVSDYDLLVMLDQPSTPIFQMQTYIDGRIADIAFVETEVAQRVLALTEPVAPTSPEGFLIGWLEGSRVVYDRSGLFSAIQRKIEEHDWRLAQPSPADEYSEWFWLNFDLRHMQRMARSTDPIHLLTVDLRLMACISSLCRTYYRLNGLHWRGEKAALRHLQTHDTETFALLTACMAEPERSRKLDSCLQLVGRILKGVGGVWADGTTALVLKAYHDHPARVQEALDYWEGLLTIKG